MVSTLSILNQSLEKHRTPVLKDVGFELTDARNAQRAVDSSIWVVNVRSLGRQFTAVTGWPSESVCVWLGVYFKFFPQDPTIKHDEKGGLMPAEANCHMRNHLDRGIDQSLKVQALSSLERDRHDIWWVEPKGGNADEVAKDIGFQFRQKALSWFTNNSDLRAALKLVEAERDRFVKYVRAAFIARELGDSSRWEKYRKLAETEARRINISCDWSAWYVAGS